MALENREGDTLLLLSSESEKKGGLFLTDLSARVSGQAEQPSLFVGAPCRRSVPSVPLRAAPRRPTCPWPAPAVDRPARARGEGARSSGQRCATTHDTPIGGGKPAQHRVASAAPTLYFERSKVRRPLKCRQWSLTPCGLGFARGMGTARGGEGTRVLRSAPLLPGFASFAQ